MRRVLVTGGTGFLGQHVVRLLLARGDRVRLLVRPASPQGETARAVERVEGNVTDAQSLRRAVKGCDRVFHLAALVRTWVRDRASFDRVNIGGFRNVMDAALAEGVERVVFTSSFLALPPAGGADARAAQRLARNDYVRTKRAADALVGPYCERGLPLLAVYPGVAYGPGALTAGNLVARLVREFLAGRIPGLLGQGSRRWSYAYAEDVARGHLLAEERGRVGERYVLGGDNVSMRDFFGLLSELTGRPAPARRIPFGLAAAAGAGEEMLARLFGRQPGTTRAVVDTLRYDWACDSSKAEQELGYAWRPLAEGLRATLAWLQESQDGNDAGTQAAR